MLAGDLIKVIKNPGFDEKRVLKKVKMLVRQRKGASLNGPQGAKPFTWTSPLIQAAKRGFTNVLRYLIEEAKPGADPNQTDFGNQSALAFAIFAKQTEAAVYLASKTTVFTKDVREGYTALHYAAGRNQIEVVQAILDQRKDIINVASKDKITALHLATEQDAHGVVELLIAANANLLLRTDQDTTAYGISLGKGKSSNIISTLLNYPDAASAIEYELCGLKYSPFQIVMDSPEKVKVPAILTLLEAGAGLDLGKIPQNVFDLLKLIGQPQKPEWEFLIVGDCKISALQTKKIFITSFEELLKHLDDPNTSFKLNKILHSAEHRSIKDIAHIQKIAEKIRLYLPTSQRSATSSSSSSSSSTRSGPGEPSENASSLESITAYPKSSLMAQFSIENARFLHTSGCIRSQIHFIFEKLSADSASVHHELEVNGIFTVYLRRLNEILNFAHHPKFKQPALFSTLAKTFSGIFAELLIFLASPDFEQYTLNIMTPFANNLREVTHNHAAVLRKKFPHVYNMLLHTHVTTLYQMAKSYIKANNFNLAQTLVSETLYFNTKIIVNNNELRLCVDHINAQSLVVLAKVHIHEGRLKAGLDNLEKALAFGPIDVGFGSHYCEALVFILDSYTHVPKERAITLLTKSIAYFTNLTLKNQVPDSLYNEAVTKERQYLPQLKEILVKFEAQVKEERAEQSKLKAQESPLKKISLPSLTEQWNEVTQKLEAIILEPSYSSTSTSPLASLPLTPSAVLSAYSSSTSSSSCSSSSATPHAPRIKIKTRGKSKPEWDSKRPKRSEKQSPITPSNGGFVVPEGYIPPVPIQGGYLSKNQFFVTMPADHPDFEPFYKLMEGGVIKCIAEHGVNQQGVKLGKAEVQITPGAPREQIAIARLRVCGGETCRPWGYIEQAYKDSEGETRKLYVFKPEGLHNKADEKSSGYKPKGFN